MTAALETEQYWEQLDIKRTGRLGQTGEAIDSILDRLKAILEKPDLDQSDTEKIRNLAEAVKSLATARSDISNLS